MGKKINYGLIITLIIFVLIFAIRLPYIGNSPAERGDMWRQPDTESIARNFVDHHFNIFYPQFNYDGPLPNYIQLEFQVTTFIIAILYKIFGHSYVIARLVPTIFFMLSALYLYLIAKKIYDREMAWITTLIYGLIPLTLFYSRAIMPESAVLFFFLGAYYHFLQWMDKEKNYELIISGIFTALAISQKTPAIFIGLAMLGLCILKYRHHFIKKGILWVFAAIALIPPYMYIRWSGSIAEFKFVSGIAEKHIFPKMISSLFTPEPWMFFKDMLPDVFTGALLILSVIGLITFRRKKDEPILFLAIAVIIETLLIVSVIKFKYYLIFLTPAVALLSGKAIYLAIKKHKIGIILSILFIGYLFNTSITRTEPYYEELTSIINFAQFIDDNTEEEDLVVISYLDPSRLSLSSRRGWRANISLYDHIPTDIEGELKYLIDNGAKYFIVHNDYIYKDQDKKYLEYLNENFEKVIFEDGYVKYILNN